MSSLATPFHIVPPRHRRFSFSPLQHLTVSPSFPSPRVLPLHCLFFNTHARTHRNTVSSPQFSISSSNVLEDFPTGVCFRLFKYSIIYTHLPTDEYTPLLPLRCIDSRLCTLSQCHVILTLGPLDKIFQT